MGRTSDKRERLIAAAKEMIHQQGFYKTTLADIASAADVPLGNVYYYFKTKEEIAEVVIQEIHDHFADLAKSAAHIESPAGRIQAIMDQIIEDKKNLTQWGCPMGKLSQELNKSDDKISGKADQLILGQLKWVESQFKAAGCKHAESLAMLWMSRVQGVILIARALQDDNIITSEITKLKEWVVETIPD